MILLISGPPRCGKTTLARKISQRTGVSWISADAISGVARATVKSLPTDQSDYLKQAYPKRAIRRATDNSNEMMYQNYSSHEIADAYKHEAKATHPGVRAVIESMTTEGHDLIIEGYQLTPELLSELVSDEVVAVVLVRADAALLAKDLPKNTAKNDWAIYKTKDPATYELIAQMISLFSGWYESEAENFDLPVYDVGSEFTDQVDRLAIEYEQLFKEG